MKSLTLGVQIDAATAAAAIEAIVRAEALGIDAVWMTLGGARPDSTAIFAAAAMRTERIKLGTAIVPTYPRHPLALSQTARVVGELAPGRLRLGVGPSHKPTMEGAWGIPYVKPLSHLREYLLVLKAALQQGGRLDFEGEFFKVHADCPGPVDVRVMASGLREKSFHLVGEVADGGISWVCPLPHIVRVALPALAAGAAAAGRPQPPLVMHTLVCVHENADEAQSAAMKRFSFYPRLPLYARMFEAAGYPEAANGAMSDRMMDAILIRGDEAAVADRLRRIAAAGVSEVICSVIGAGADPAASTDRTLRLLADLSRAE